MDSKISVCFVQFRFHPIFSGHAIFLQKLIPKLQKRGVNACVLTARLDNSSKYECINGVDVYRIPVLRYRTLVTHISFVFSCFAHLFFKDRQYNIIHVSSSKIIGLLSGLFKIFGAKTIFQMSLLGSDDPEAVKSRFGRLSLKLYALANAFISPSTAMSSSYHKMNLPAHKLFQIPYATDPDTFQPLGPEQKQVIRQKLGLPQQGKLVACVGGIIKRKGVDFLIDAWADVCKQYQGAHLLLIGPFLEADFLAEMKQRIQQNRIHNKVSFVGQVDNVHEYMGAADIFAFCAHREGLPNALIEAVSCGLPCVVLRMEGITDDIFTHGVDGIVVENRDVHEYAKALLEVLRDDALAHQLGIHARQTVLEKFSLDAVCDRYIELYQKLLS